MRCQPQGSAARFPAGPWPLIPRGAPAHQPEDQNAGTGFLPPPYHTAGLIVS